MERLDFTHNVKIKNTPGTIAKIIVSVVEANKVKVADSQPDAGETQQSAQSSKSKDNDSQMFAAATSSYSESEETDRENYESETQDSLESIQETEEQQVGIFDRVQKDVEKIHNSLQADLFAQEEAEREAKQDKEKDFELAESNKKEEKEDQKGFFESLIGSFSDLWSSLKSWGSNIMSLLGKVGPAVVSLAKSAGGAIMGGLKTAGGALKATGGALKAAGSSALGWLTGGLGVGGLMSSSAGAALSGSLGMGAAVGAGAGVAAAAGGGLVAGDYIASKAGVGVYGWAQQAEKQSEKLEKSASTEKDELKKAEQELMALNMKAEAEKQRSIAGLTGWFKSADDAVASEETLKAIAEKMEEIKMLRKQRKKAEVQYKENSLQVDVDGTVKQLDRTDREDAAKNYDMYKKDLNSFSPSDSISNEMAAAHGALHDAVYSKNQRLERQQSENADRYQRDLENNYDERAAKDYTTSLKNQLTEMMVRNQRAASKEELEDAKINAYEGAKINYTQRTGKIGGETLKANQDLEPPSEGNNKVSPEQQDYLERTYGKNVPGLQSEDEDEIRNQLAEEQGVKPEDIQNIKVSANQSIRQAQNQQRQRDWIKQNPDDADARRIVEERANLKRSMEELGGSKGGEGASNLLPENVKPAQPSMEGKANKTLSSNIGYKLDQISEQINKQAAPAPTQVAVTDNSSSAYHTGAQFYRNVQNEMRMT